MSRHPPFKQVEASRPDFDKGASFHLTKTPQPDWRPGQGLNAADLPNAAAFADPRFKTFIPYENLAVPDAYKLMIGSVVPRPICFCSSINGQGETNLAPFSYFGAVGHNPPILMVSFSASGPKEKDSARNIKETKQFVANIISEAFIEAANYCSVDAPLGVSEWKLSGLTQEPSVKVKPARCRESAIAMECELEHVYETFDEQDSTRLTATMILGRIKAWHVREDLLVDGGPTIALEKFQPVTRIGGIAYGRIVSGYELPRPQWEEEKQRPEVNALL